MARDLATRLRSPGLSIKWLAQPGEMAARSLTPVRHPVAKNAFRTPE